jgi:hypothetical protein
MMFGENPDKVSNILTRPGNLEKFQAMYSRVLVDMEKEGLLQRHGQTENFSQNTAKHVILTETRLPRNLEAHCTFIHLYTTSPHCVVDSPQPTPNSPRNIEKMAECANATSSATIIIQHHWYIK